MPSAFGQLIPVNGGNAIPLGQTRCVVGRAADCDVVLPYRTVSSKHCLLEIRDGAWFVTDLASSNGIRIDGARCREGRLPRGSVLSIAEHRFEVVSLSGQTSTAGVSAPRNEPTELKVELNSEISEFSATQIPGQISSDPSHPPAPLQSPIQSPPQSAPPLANLMPLDGGAAIPLKCSRLLIGRAQVCNIVLQYPEVSGKHCQLDLHDGLWHVRDLGSRNGIQVDGKRETAASLKPNAILSIAKHRFKIVYEPQLNEFECADDPIATIDLEEVVQTDRMTFEDFPEAALAVEAATSGEQSANDARDMP